MNRITQEDLENLFNKKEVEKNSSNKIRIHKNINDKTDKIVLKKIRKKIRKTLPQNSTLIFNSWDSILKFIMIAGFSGFIFFIILNYQAYFSQIKWLYFVEYLKVDMPSEKPKIEPTATPMSKNTLTLPNLNLETKTNASILVIDKIKVNAPIIWDVEEENIIEQLKNGVAHYRQTAMPGESGNVFIVGHSSNYFWIQSDFNQVFALLDKLTLGDRIEIKKDGKSYYYDVFQTKEVNPQDVSVLERSDGQILTLMTCWPVGTSINRLIVQAEFSYAAN